MLNSENDMSLNKNIHIVAMRKVILFLFILFTVTLQGQNVFNRITNEVTAINSQELYKAYIVPSGKDEPFFTVSSPSQIDSAVRARYFPFQADSIYYDLEGRLRKVKLNSEYGSIIGSTSYYDEQGYMIYSIEYDVYEEISYSSITFFEKGRVIFRKGMIFVDQKEQPCYFRFENGMFIETENNYIPSYYNIVPDTNYIYHIDNIKKGYINDLKMPMNCKKVRFEQPQKGDVTIVNNYNVLIRKEPSVHAEKIYIIDQQGIPVFVKKRIPPSHESNHPWFEIEYINDLSSEKYTGYIYGLFLELVEKIIE